MRERGEDKGGKEEEREKGGIERKGQRDMMINRKEMVKRNR